MLYLTNVIFIIILEFISFYFIHVILNFSLWIILGFEGDAGSVKAVWI